MTKPQLMREPISGTYQMKSTDKNMNNFSPLGFLKTSQPVKG